MTKRSNGGWLRVLGAAMVMAAIGWAMPARAQIFSWAQGQPAVAMQPEKSHWCYLIEVRGKFRGNGERVEVQVDKGRWVLSGASQQEGVSGRANCIATALLKPAAGTRMQSGPFARQWAAADECVGNPIRAWWGDAATVISGFGGDLQGGGEYLEVRQSMEGKGHTMATSHTCRSQTFAAVTSFFVGTPQSGKLARFIGPGGTGNAKQAGEFSAHNGGGTVVMAPVGDAICYFTYIGGGFHGGAEGPRIFQQNGRWALRAEAKSGDGIRARARCFTFDQS